MPWTERTEKGDLKIRYRDLTGKKLTVRRVRFSNQQSARESDEWHRARKN